MKLSVHMITYNHEKFIGRAIESVLMQKTNFDYELVIGDDKSTDDTRKIIEDYKKRYPEIIKLNFHNVNMGSINNFKSTLEACSGEYIAILEGDDYWIDENKLQKQVDFLDKNKEYSMCFTDYKELNNKSGNFVVKYAYDLCKDFNTENLIRFNFIPHLTCVFRNKDINSYPEWLWECSILDYPMHLLRSLDGKIGFINDVTSVYRKHDLGVTNRSKETWWNYQLINVMQNFDKHTYYKYHKFIERSIAINYSYIMLNENNKNIAKDIFKKYLFKGLNSRAVLKNKLKFILYYLRGKY